MWRVIPDDPPNNKAPYTGLFYLCVFKVRSPVGSTKIAGSDFERTQYGPKGESQG